MSDKYDMAPYNRRELGDIQNVDDEDYVKMFRTDLYQILPWRYAKSIIQNRRLRFNNISKAWEDPFELFLYKEIVDVEGRPLGKSMTSWAQRYYGQCWSMSRDTDAMWRIYSQDKHSVRIKTNFCKMMEIMNETRGIMWTAPLFGRVIYRSKEEMGEWLKEVVEKGWGYFMHYLSDSLFIKRPEFQHENEVRFLISQTDNHEILDYFEMEIPREDFIEEIALDPRLTQDEYQDFAKEVKTVAGEIDVCQSDLYKFDAIHLSLKDGPFVIR